MADLSKIKNTADNIRKDVLEMTYHSGVNGGHLGGAFSAAEIFAVLYCEVLNVNDKYTQDRNRNRFILSKGHTAIAHYAALAETGIISKDEMMTFEVSGSDYPTHEIMNIEKGIEFSGGSLGYGSSLGVGTALMAKRSGHSYHTYVLMGDGECNEGSVWEAIMSAVRFKLDNITFIIDANGQQMDGFTDDVIPIRDFEKICLGFGCNVVSVDGNDVEQLLDAFAMHIVDKPNVIIANTVKGKGLPSAEGKIGFHHVRLTEESYNQYRREMGVE